MNPQQALRRLRRRGRANPLRVLEDNFRRPTGLPGRLVGHLMAVQHRTLTLWALHHMAVRPGQRVLDIGCGGGMALRLLSDRAGFVAGIDYSADMAAQAISRNAAAVTRGAVEVCQADAMALPYGDEEFDQVCAIETFYFWPDPIRGLTEALRVLKPGGQVMIALEMSREAATDPSLFQRVVGRRFTARAERDGLRILSGEQLLSMLAEAGFVEPRFDSEPRKSLGWLCARARKEDN